MEGDGATNEEVGRVAGRGARRGSLWAALRHVDGGDGI